MIAGGLFSALASGCPIAPLGVIGPRRPPRSRAWALWTIHASSFGLVAATTSGCSSPASWSLWAFCRFHFAAVDRSRGSASRRILRAHALRAGRHDADGDRTTHRHLLALEVLSLAVYVPDRHPAGIRPIATEAAFKYSCSRVSRALFFLYGIAFTYGVTGSTHLDRIGSVLSAQALNPTPMQLIAVGLLARRVSFKVSAVPVSHVDAGCVRGRASAVTAVHVHGREGGGVSRHSSASSVRARAAARQLGRRALAGGGGER